MAHRHVPPQNSPASPCEPCATQAADCAERPRAPSRAAVRRTSTRGRPDAEHRRLLRKHEVRKAEIAREAERLELERQAEQRLLEVAHERLLGGDPAAIRVAVCAALKTHPVRTELAAVENQRIWLAVFAPPVESLVPERELSVTGSGKPTTRKRNKGDRNELYAEALCGAALGAARSALTAAPPVGHATVVVFAGDNPGHPPVAYCQVSRDDWKQWAPSSTDVVTAFYDCDGIIEQGGRAREIRPLDLPEDPSLAAAVERIRAALWT
jgi:hypothetical protein